MGHERLEFLWILLIFYKFATFPLCNVQFRLLRNALSTQEKGKRLPPEKKYTD